MLYTQVLVGSNRSFLSRYAGKPWADVVQAAKGTLHFCGEADLLRQRDKEGRDIETRPSDEFYGVHHLRKDNYALRPIESGGQMVAGLWIQNF